MKKFLFVLTTGFALFSMFFGAGNLVYPLKLGLNTQENCMTAVAGFSVTAVLVPLLGFLAMILFEGDWRAFFGKIGKRSGFVLVTLILCVFGPFGGIPRCIALSYASVHEVFPDLSLAVFSFFACVTIFLLTYRENRIVQLLGKVLTPLLLVTLSIVLIAGLSSESSFTLATENSGKHFYSGMLEGYQTLDLLAALLFSAFLYPTLVRYEKKNLFSLGCQVALVCGVLLTVAYTGFCYLAGANHPVLSTSPHELMLVTLSGHFLGERSAKVAMLLVVLACLTTAIVLAAIFAEFVKKDVLKEKVGYEYCLGATLFVSFFFATLSFNGIVSMLAPVLEICYPALIVLCVLNSCHKLFGFRYVKSAFFVALGGTLLAIYC